MLIEIAMADAYGAGFEYCHRTFIDRRHDLTGYVAHPWHKLRPGCYTDDTQMSMALAELMLSPDEWTARVVADRFVRVFQRDPRKGYSKSFYSFLLKATTSDLFLRDVHADSAKNGAAMRSVPVGVHPDMAVVKARSEAQARVTHDTEEGAASAVAVSLMSHYFLYGLGTRDGLPAFLEEHVPVAGHSWDRPWDEEVGSGGLATATAALWVVVRTGSLSQALRRAVDLGGDVDTVAAIALGVASCSLEHERDLPGFLFHDLENGVAGRDYLLRLDRRLAHAHALPILARGSAAGA